MYGEVFGIPWLTLLVIAAVVIYAGFFLGFFRSMQKTAKRRKKRLFDAITGAFQRNTLQSIEDIRNLYQGVFRISGENEFYYRGLVRALKEYLVDLSAGSVEAEVADNEKAIVRQNAAAWKEILTSYIKQIERTSPYSELPQIERSIMTDIVGFLEANKKQDVERKLGDLANAIQLREDAFARISKANRWSIPLAIIGFVLTILFGIISIVR